MVTQSKHSSTRSFDVSALSGEARDAVNAAFDAMSTWRTDAVENNEKSLEQVIEKMAVAARALGWPEQIVEATRSQMQSVTKAQITLVDQMVEAWESQIKSPNPAAMLSTLNPPSGFGPAGSWANAAGVSAMNPMQLYVQFFEQWQKAWSDAIALWTKTAVPPGGARPLS
jgi:hypothetical protein